MDFQHHFSQCGPLTSTEPQQHHRRPSQQQQQDSQPRSPKLTTEPGPIYTEIEEDYWGDCSPELAPGIHTTAVTTASIQFEGVLHTRADHSPPAFSRHRKKDSHGRVSRDLQVSGYPDRTGYIYANEDSEERKFAVNAGGGMEGPEDQSGFRDFFAARVEERLRRHTDSARIGIREQEAARRTAVSSLVQSDFEKHGSGGSLSSPDERDYSHEQDSIEIYATSRHPRSHANPTLVSSTPIHEPSLHQQYQRQTHPIEATEFIIDLNDLENEKKRKERAEIDEYNTIVLGLSGYRTQGYSESAQDEYNQFDLNPMAAPFVPTTRYQNCPPPHLLRPEQYGRPRSFFGTGLEGKKGRVARESQRNQAQQRQEERMLLFLEEEDTFGNCGTAYILQHAFDVGADYDDIHQLYAKRYGGDVNDDDAVQAAFLKDVAKILSEEQRNNWSNEMDALNPGQSNLKVRRRAADEEMSMFLERLRRESNRYRTHQKTHHLRTPKQQIRYEATQKLDMQLSQAEKATTIEISIMQRGLDALEASGEYAHHTWKRDLVQGIYEDLRILENRLEELKEATKGILEKRVREKEFVAKMRDQGWEGAIYIDEEEEDHDEVRFGDGKKKLFMAWGVEDSIEAALKGIGALVIGYVDSESDEEVIVGRGYKAEGDDFWGAARKEKLPDRIDISGVVDVESTPTLDSISRDIIELQKAADGTVESSRKLLAKLYVYDYIRSLRILATNELDVAQNSQEFVRSLCEVLRPSQAVVDEIDLEQDPFKGLSPTPNLDIFKITAKISLSIVRDILTENFLITHTEIRNDIVEALATHSDQMIEWTTEENAQICENVLETYASLFISEGVLVEYILKSIIKPLFGKGPRTITSQGRKAIRVPQTKSEVFTFADEKPWRKDKPEALCLLGFAVTNLTPGSIEQNWHLIVPPILTALDEGDILSKTHACGILERVIGSVSHEFLSPLKVLSTRRYASVDNGMRYNALDKILREGMFHGMTYAGENVMMVETFLEETRSLVEILGVRSVRHLSKLIPFCTAPMVSPFVMTYPEVAYQAAMALIDVIRNCWPRIPERNGEILKAIVLCWMRVKDEEDDGIVKLLREGLKVMTALLERANLGTGWFEEARNAIVGKDEALRGVFGFCAMRES
ncbi:hypothetical protein ABW20_dc0110354 [Dactylellina cionopaga]|nr:hypothetical protein ABW20_dc0110354 [Dactylellina cionopaga]